MKQSAVVDFAESLLVQHPLERNIYFQLLVSEHASVTWFRITQEPFVHAVNKWSHVMAILLAQLSKPEQRAVVVQNLMDEHGLPDGTSHVSTFMQLLQAMGSPYVSFDEVPQHPCVTQFIDTITSMQGDWVQLTAAIGMVEYGFATVSRWMSQFCTEKAVTQTHYGNHSGLDIEHAVELFALLPEDEQYRSAVETGMRVGWQSMYTLYEQLADHRDHGIKFASVMEDPCIETELLQGRGDANTAQRVCMVGSGGCTLLEILSGAPYDVDVADTNTEQLYLIKLKLTGARLFASCPQQFDRLLTGGLTNADVAHVVAEIQCEDARAYWARRLHHIRDGVARMGAYEHVFRKLVASGDVQTAFQEASLNRQFGARVSTYCTTDIATTFSKLLPLPRTEYFRSIIDGTHHVSPAFTQRLSCVGANTSAATVRFHNSDMTHVLETSPMCYDLVCASNITDWMSQQEAERLILAARAALKDDGILLLRRIGGKFELDLGAYGFTLHKEHHDNSGLYQQTRSFVKYVEPSDADLHAFETRVNAWYPLGATDRFRIRHGQRYTAFFHRLGETLYRASYDEHRDIVATCAAVLRPAPGCAGTRAWYLGDARVREDHLGRRLPLQTMQGVLGQCVKRCNAIFAVEMGVGESRILKLLQYSCPGTSFSVIHLNVYMLPGSVARDNPDVLYHTFGADGTVFLNLTGVKDLVLESTGTPMKLLHVHPRDRTQATDVHSCLVDASAMYCMCAVQGSKLAVLLDQLTTPCPAKIIHANMHNADWNQLSTAEV